MSVTIHKHGNYLYFWDPFCICGICVYECSQVCGHTCKYRYICNCMFLCMSMFVAVEIVTWYLFFPTLYFEEDFWLNLDPLYFTSLTHHRVPNRVPPESWDDRSASIPAYCLCEGWRPECQTSCFDAKYLSTLTTGISPSPFFCIVCMNFVYFIINISCTFQYFHLHISFLWVVTLWFKCQISCVHCSFTEV